MCGIAGIIGSLRGPNRDALRRMSDALVHRGPDAEGYWESAADTRGRGALFAFRRLAILDLSPSGEQPMVDPVTGHAVVYNGEIYNYVELRERLTAAGQTFKSSGDTAVMLRAVALHGREAVGWLRGMFAFAAWDPRERKLLVARDALGIKPLYYAHNPDQDGEWSVVFASEIRAILASGLLGEPRLNPLAPAMLAWNGFMVAPETAIEGISSLWPGQLRVFDSNGREELQERFWSMPAAGQAAPDEQRMACSLEHSVRLHLASDVPLGVFLSGGIDSSAVANLACRTSKAPVHTFTLAFEEAEYDEGPFARRIAQAIGTQHREVVLTQGQVVSGLENALNSLDQPTFDGLNSYYMSNAVRQAGFTVALVGTGGDELFGGYTSFRDLPTLQSLSAHTRWVPTGTRVALAKLLSRLLQPSRGGVPGQTRWAKLPGMAERGEDLVSLYQLAYALFLPDFQSELLAGSGATALADGLPAVMRSRLEQDTGGRSPLAAISALEQRMFLGERLLRDTDAASMAASIEVRLPLVDQMLLADVYAMPDGARYRPLRRKDALRRAGLQGLDPGLFERPKSGFVLPFDRWSRAGLGKVMNETLQDPTLIRPTGLNPEGVRRLWTAYRDGAPGLYWTRAWALFAYIRWCHRHRAYL